jgi:N-acetylglucosaminyl-diphospho-decaprenol L-rhamnosyltransferase
MMAARPGGSVPTVSIIIVNWNSGNHLAQCLASITAAVKDAFRIERVVVVDNASQDRSADGLSTVELPLYVIQNPVNRGFAAACNQGANGSQAAYLLFLNPDTRLFPASLTKPLAFMELPQNRQIGIVGVQLVDADGRVSRTCARFPTPGRFFSKILGLDRALPSLFPSHFMTEWDHQTSGEVDQVMGAWFLVRRSMFEALGGFDERFFLYFDEVDLAARARAVGWRTFYLSDAQAYHRGGGGSDRVTPTRLFYSLRSRILYAYKHFGWWPATGVLLGTLALEPAARVALSLAHGSARELKATFRAYAMLLGAMPEIVRTAWLGSEV